MGYSRYARTIFVPRYATIQPAEPARPDNIQEVQPLTNFQERPAELIALVKAISRPITLTVDGQPAVILQEPAEYERLRDLAALADPEDGLRQGLEDIAADRTRPAREGFAELTEEYGIRGYALETSYQRSASHLRGDWRRRILCR